MDLSKISRNIQRKEKVNSRPKVPDLQDSQVPNKELPDHHWQNEYSSTAAYLEDLTLRLTAELQNPNPRSSSAMRKHVHEDFMLAHPLEQDCGIPFANGREALFDSIQQNLKGRGLYVKEIRNVSVNVQKGSKRAVVFMTVHERGTVNGEVLSREGVSVIHWERSIEDQWVWEMRRHTALRGGGFFMGW